MKEGITTYLSASGGFAEVVEDKVVMLLDTAEPAEEIDIERAKRAMERAEAALKTTSFDHAEYLLYEMALYRAVARISVASKKIG
jgi:F-type H+-transporting ATPase subunit epsilon